MKFHYANVTRGRNILRYNKYIGVVNRFLKKFTLTNVEYGSWN